MKNVKLVVTDMDGCLLKNDKTMPEDIFDLIDDCHRNDILFSVASGRSYFDLTEQFKSKLDDILLICDNGALIYNKGKIIYRDEMKHEFLGMVIDRLRSMKGSVPIYVTETDSYIEKDTLIDDECMHLITHYYSDYQLIDDIKAMKLDLCKITVCNGAGTKENTYPHLEEFNGDYKVVVSGYNWLDISSPSVNKGAGVEHIRDLLGIENRETVIFGDYLNDLEMFEVSENAFAVANAAPEILKLASRVVESNEDYGVTNTIKEIISMKKEYGIA